MSTTKPDCDAFAQTLNQLRAQYAHDARRVWPHFAFHFTSVHNAARVLTQGQLLSRAAAHAQGTAFDDTASESVLSHTLEQYQRCVRFYLRPKTPMLYNVEGFRPADERNSAYCPMPVYLLFDLKELLCQPGTLFSDDNCGASYVRVMSSAEEFATLPFDSIYHNTWFERYERDTIVFHRHAEVLVPDAVDLAHLKYVYCRSEAERETLLILLPESVRSHYVGRVRFGAEHDLFHNKWQFIQQATLGPHHLDLSFNLTVTEPLDCVLSLHTPAQTINDPMPHRTHHFRVPENWRPARLPWEPDPALANGYTATITLHGDLAYQGHYTPANDPSVPF